MQASIEVVAVDSLVYVCRGSKWDILLTFVWRAGATII